MPRSLPAGARGAIEALAGRQHGLIRHKQLVALGLGRSTVASLTRTGGPWQRVLPGTYFLPSAPLEQVDRERAALLYCDGYGQLTGVAALRHYGLRYLPSPATHPDVHVLIPHDRSRVSYGFVRVERTVRYPEPVTLHSLPVAPLARAVFDAGRSFQDRDVVRALVLEALQNERVLPAQLEFELDVGQRRWTAACREALKLYETGTDSSPEATLRLTWERGDRAPLLWNPGLYTPSGLFIARVDGYDEETGMAVEVESREHHSGTRWAKGVDRHRRMSAHGIVVVPVSVASILADVDQVVEDIARTRESLLGRPLPDLVVVRSWS